MQFIRSKGERPHIEIAPLVDIIFLLLFFFMISSNFINPNIRMELPKASAEDKLEKVDLVVTVDRDNRIFVNKNQIDPVNLETALEEKMASLGRHDIIFRGDKAIGYDVFIKILDTAKSAGATSFSVEHEK